MYNNSFEEIFDSLAKIDNMSEEEAQNINPEYKARIEIIAAFCDANKIPYNLNPLFGGYQITFPWCSGDVACHIGTYGVDEGLVESFQFPWDEDNVSIFSPSAMAALIINYYNTLYNLIE